MLVTADWVTAGANAAMAAGAGLGGWAAWRGVHAWRAEVVGRRKAELAEEVLAQFYRARDALVWARLPAHVPGADALHGSAASISAPVERLTEESQLFSELQASRYRFMAYFGVGAARPFDEVRAIHAEVVRSAEELARDAGDAGDDAHDRRTGWRRSIGWGATTGDQLARRLEKVILDIEQACRPLIDESARRSRRRTPQR